MAAFWGLDLVCDLRDVIRDISLNEEQTYGAKFNERGMKKQIEKNISALSQAGACAHLPVSRRIRGSFFSFSSDFMYEYILFRDKYDIFHLLALNCSKKNSRKKIHAKNRSNKSNISDKSLRQIPSRRNHKSEKSNQKSEKFNNFEKSEKSNKVEKSEKSNKFDKYDKSNKIEKSEKLNKFEKSRKLNRSEKSEKSGKLEKSEKSNKFENSEKSNRLEKSQKSNKSHKPSHLIDHLLTHLHLKREAARKGGELEEERYEKSSEKSGKNCSEKFEENGARRKDAAVYTILQPDSHASETNLTEALVSTLDSRCDVSSRVNISADLREKGRSLPNGGASCGVDSVEDWEGKCDKKKERPKIRADLHEEVDELLQCYSETPLQGYVKNAKIYTELGIYDAGTLSRISAPEEYRRICLYEGSRAHGYFQHAEERIRVSKTGSHQDEPFVDKTEHQLNQPYNSDSNKIAPHPKIPAKCFNAEWSEIHKQIAKNISNTTNFVYENPTRVAGNGSCGPAEMKHGEGKKMYYNCDDSPMIFSYSPPFTPVHFASSHFSNEFPSTPFCTPPALSPPPQFPPAPLVSEYSPTILNAPHRLFTLVKEKLFAQKNVNNEDFFKVYNIYNYDLPPHLTPTSVKFTPKGSKLTPISSPVTFKDIRTSVDRMSMRSKTGKQSQFNIAVEEGQGRCADHTEPHSEATFDAEKLRVSKRNADANYDKIGHGGKKSEIYNENLNRTGDTFVSLLQKLNPLAKRGHGEGRDIHPNDSTNTLQKSKLSHTCEQGNEVSSCQTKPLSEESKSDKDRQDLEKFDVALNGDRRSQISEAGRSAGSEGSEQTTENRTKGMYCLPTCCTPESEEVTAFLATMSKRRYFVLGCNRGCETLFRRSAALSSAMGPLRNMQKHINYSIASNCTGYNMLSISPLRRGDLRNLLYSEYCGAFRADLLADVSKAINLLRTITLIVAELHSNHFSINAYLQHAKLPHYSTTGLKHYHRDGHNVFVTAPKNSPDSVHTPTNIHSNIINVSNHSAPNFRTHNFSNFGAPHGDFEGSFPTGSPYSGRHTTVPHVGGGSPVGLKYAKHGLVHTDLKLENFLFDVMYLERSDASSVKKSEISGAHDQDTYARFDAAQCRPLKFEYKVWLTDFDGLINEGHKLQGNSTPGYISPQLHRAHKNRDKHYLGCQSDDCWALGEVLRRVSKSLIRPCSRSSAGILAHHNLVREDKLQQTYDKAYIVFVKCILPIIQKLQAFNPEERLSSQQALQLFDTHMPLLWLQRDKGKIYRMCKGDPADGKASYAIAKGREPKGKAEFQIMHWEGKEFSLGKADNNSADNGLAKDILVHQEREVNSENKWGSNQQDTAFSRDQGARVVQNICNKGSIQNYGQSNIEKCDEAGREKDGGSKEVQSGTLPLRKSGEKVDEVGQRNSEEYKMYENSLRRYASRRGSLTPRMQVANAYMPSQIYYIPDSMPPPPAVPIHVSLSSLTPTYSPLLPPTPTHAFSPHLSERNRFGMEGKPSESE